jgi:uncharacterized protein YxeA
MARKPLNTGLIVVAVAIVMAAALGVASYFVVKNVGRGGRLTEVTTEKDTEQAKEDVTEATTEERNTTISSMDKYGLNLNKRP